MYERDVQRCVRWTPTKREEDNSGYRGVMSIRCVCFVKSQIDGHLAEGNRG